MAFPISLLLTNTPTSTIQSVEWAIYPDNTYDPTTRAVVTTTTTNYISNVTTPGIVLQPTNDVYAEAVVTSTSGQVSTYRAYLGNIGDPVNTFVPTMGTIPYPQIRRRLTTGNIEIYDGNGVLDYYFTNNLVQQFDWYVAPQDAGNDFVFSDMIRMINDTSATSTTITISPTDFQNVTNLSGAFVYYRLTTTDGSVYTFANFSNLLVEP